MGGSSGWVRAQRFVTEHRRAIFWIVSLVLAVLWNRPFIYDQKVGGFDWPKEYYYLDYLKTALQHHTWPITMVGLPDALSPTSWPFVKYQQLTHSASYLANPEVLLFSPLLPLLRFVNLVSFVKLSWTAHLTLAVAGIDLLGESLGLTLAARLGLVVAWPLNPWLVQHLVLGYTPMLTMCLLPLVAAGLAPATWSAKRWALASVALALMVYEGGFHPFVWTAMALGVLWALLVASGSGAARRIALVGLGALLLAAPRLLASKAVFGDMTRAVTPSYDSLDDLWGLLTDQAKAATQYQPLHKTPFYDSSLYMGRWFLYGAALALARLAVLPRRERVASRGVLIACWLTSVLFVVLGWHPIWDGVAKALPLLTCEVYPYRFLWLGIALASFPIVVELDSVFRTRAPRWRWAIAVALVLYPTLVTVKGLHTRSRYFVSATVPFDLKFYDRYRWQRAWRVIRMTGDPASPIGTLVTSEGVTLRGTPWTRANLPWAGQLNPRDFDIRGAAVAAFGLQGAIVELQAPVAQIRARTFHFGRNLALGLFAWATCFWLLRRRDRKRRAAAAPATTVEPAAPLAEAA